MAESAQMGTQLARIGESAGASAGSAAALAGRARAWFAAVNPARRRQLIAAVLFAGAIIAALCWYANRPDWRLLFSGLESKDLQQVAQELSAANIPYQMTEDGGGIRVNADQMDRARMQVATKGMPQSGRMGFELFDKPNWVGSEFDEKVNQNMVMPGSASSSSTTSAGLQIGLGTKSTASEVIMTQGQFNQTSNPLDLAIQGSGFFQVQLPNGTIGYTRDGNFSLNNAGVVVDSHGNQLLPAVNTALSPPRCPARPM